MEYLLIALLCNHVGGCKLKVERFETEAACQTEIQWQRTNNGGYDKDHAQCVPVAALPKGKQ